MNKDYKNKAHKTSNMGIAISMGGGIGIIFDLLFFDGMGIGITIGAGIGIALSSFNRSNKIKMLCVYCRIISVKRFISASIFR